MVAYPCGPSLAVDHLWGTIPGAAVDHPWWGTIPSGGPSLVGEGPSQAVDDPWWTIPGGVLSLAVDIPGGEPSLAVDHL